MQVVAGEAVQPVRQQVLLDAGQRRDALAVGEQAAVARRDRLARRQQPVHRDLDVPELTGHPGGAAHHPPAFDHAAAEPGSHDQRHRGASGGFRPEVNVVRVQRRGVRVVVVDDRQAEPGLQGAADVEPAPGRIGEVHRAPRRDHPVGAGRAGGVQAHRLHRRPGHPGQAEDAGERVVERLDGHRRAFPDPAGRLHQPVNQEPAGAVEHGRVDGCPAVVEAHHDLPALTWHRAPFPRHRNGAPPAAAGHPRRLSTNHDSTNGSGRQCSVLINAPLATARSSACVCRPSGRA